MTATVSAAQTFANLDAGGWSALGTMILAVGGVGTTVWALFTYRRAKRFEAARWIEGLFREFYLNDRFRNLKQVIQYDFSTDLAPLLERRLTDRDVRTTSEERRLLEDLDIMLNYFEQLLYLEENSQVKKRDREAFFNYWFDLIKGDAQESLRRYIAVWDFERLAAQIAAPRHEYVAVYGSLMQGLELPDAPRLQNDLLDGVPCRIPGQLFDTGKGYPALVPGAGSVTGQVHQVRHLLPHDDAQGIFRRLDAYERYDAADRRTSLYIRRVVRLQDPAVDAWVYVYNQDLAGCARIASGDWRDVRAGS